MTRKDAMILLAVLLAAAAAALAINQYALNNFPNSADEHAYLFQTQIFAMGKLTVPAHLQQPYISPFYIVARLDRVFSIFPPGWPAILSLGVMAGAPQIVNPLLCALTLAAVFFAARRALGRTSAWIVVGLLLFSPCFLFNGASYFSHTACLLGASLTFLFFIKWGQEERYSAALLAGFFFSWTFAIREMTCLALLSPPLVYFFFQSRLRWRFAVLFVLGALPIGIVYLLYNHALTGFWLHPPRYLLPGERLGFGPREIRLFDYVEIKPFGPAQALTYMFRNLGRLFLWTFPALPLAAFWGAWKRRSLALAWTRVFALSALALPLAYFFYPSDGGNQYGPRFYFEALLPLSLLAAPWLEELRVRFVKTKRNILLVVLIILLGADGMMVGIHWRFYSHQIYRRQSLYRLADHFHLHNALVFVSAPSGDMTQGDLIRNSPFPDSSEVVYIWDMGAQNTELARSFPGRSSYIFGRDPQTGVNFLRPLSPRLGDK
ncbi:MAG: glycosyltransferase family 39 protein [Candidatus Omnitrophota bacterium]